jgi:hypothetical protein
MPRSWSSLAGVGVKLVEIAISKAAARLSRVVSP